MAAFSARVSMPVADPMVTWLARGAWKLGWKREAATTLMQLESNQRTTVQSTRLCTSADHLDRTGIAPVQSRPRGTTERVCTPQLLPVRLEGRESSGAKEEASDQEAFSGESNRQRVRPPGLGDCRTP